MSISRAEDGGSWPLLRGEYDRSPLLGGAMPDPDTLTPQPSAEGHDLKPPPPGRAVLWPVTLPLMPPVLLVGWAWLIKEPVRAPDGGEGINFIVACGVCAAVWLVASLVGIVFSIARPARPVVLTTVACIVASVPLWIAAFLVCSRILH